MNKQLHKTKHFNAKSLIILIIFIVIIGSIFLLYYSSNSNTLKEISSTDQIDWSNQVEKEAQSYAEAHYALAYEGTSTVTITTITPNFDDSYSVYGTATCNDYYGDQYKGKFYMECKIDFEKAQNKIDTSNTTSETDFTDCISIVTNDLGVPTSNRFTGN